MYIIMKKLYMHTVIGSSGRSHVLMILFSLYGLKKAGLFDGNLFWVGHSITASLPTSILEEEQKYDLMKFLSSLSKIISSQETVDAILKMLASLVFL